MRSARTALLGLASLLPCLSALAQDPPAYVTEKDECFGWTAKTTTKVEGGEVSVLRLVSQKWQGIEWKHWMHVLHPDKVTHPDKALFVVSGGKIREEEPGALTPEVLLLGQMAIRTESIIVIIGQVPNQPLFEGKNEDALIAHTFDQYLKTGDASWPALMPMAKSAMRGMDAAQAFIKEKYDLKIEKFVVAGASKRGWTTWLTAAFDPRVEAIAPMVIDTLNFPKQMPLQLVSFGGTFSDEIDDYTKLGLQKKMMTPEGGKLLQMVDPYFYRERFTMPKLIVLGTNDRYWPADALKQYLFDLPGETRIHYVPNAGHALAAGALEAISAWYLDILDKKPRPDFEWKLAQNDNTMVMSVSAKDEPVKVELWQAKNETRDLRDSLWTATTVEKVDGIWTGKVEVPENGFKAFHVRLTYKSAALGIEYSLCTNTEVVGKVKAKDEEEEEEDEEDE